MIGKIDGKFARLYRYFYGVKQLPYNLYTYLFNCIILLLLIIPVTICGMPAYLLEFLVCRFDKNLHLSETAMDRLKVTFILTCIVIVIVSIIISYYNMFSTYHCKNYKVDILIKIGTCINTIIGLFIFKWLYFKIKPLFKSLIEKLCKNSPKIKWE